MKVHSSHVSLSFYASMTTLIQDGETLSLNNKHAGKDFGRRRNIFLIFPRK